MLAVEDFVCMQDISPKTKQSCPMVHMDAIFHLVFHFCIAHPPLGTDTIKNLRGSLM